MPDSCAHCGSEADTVDLVQVWGDAFMHPACSAMFYAEYNAVLADEHLSALTMPEFGGEG